jgi:TPR repeat protein
LAAEHGDTASMIRLAALLSGEGEARDLGAATSLLQRAIGIGDSNQAWAWYTMADVLRASDDAPGAVEAYAVGVDAGDPAAMIQLAAMLGRGEGVHVPDPDAAIDLLERAIAIDGDHVAWGQRILAELHLSLAATDRRHLAGALKYYTALAAAGDGSAHLAVAEIMAAERGGPEKWRDMIQHYREAARALGVETVTASMLRLDPTAMYASVQILLTEAGYQTGYVDGIRGKRTEAAIEGFCQDNRPPSGCMSSIVTRGLLGALIEASS